LVEGGYFFLLYTCTIRAIIPMITRQNVNNSIYVTIDTPFPGVKSTPINEG